MFYSFLVKEFIILIYHNSIIRRSKIIVIHEICRLLCCFFKVVVDNGIIQLTFSNPAGLVTAIKYKGFDNVLNERTKNRVYDKFLFFW